VARERRISDNDFIIGQSRQSWPDPYDELGSKFHHIRSDPFEHRGPPWL
jgi:hypothetical protein